MHALDTISTQFALTKAHHKLHVRLDEQMIGSKHLNFVTGTSP